MNNKGTLGLDKVYHKIEIIYLPISLFCCVLC